jgi:hypothetical protein
MDAIAGDLYTDLSRLVIEHAWRNDHAADRLHELYTEGGSIVMTGVELHGASAIAEWGAQRAAASRVTRHLCNNMRFERVDERRVRGTTLVSVLIFEPPGPGTPVPFAIGEFTDQLVQGDDGVWRFDSHTYGLLFGGS